MMKRIVSLLFLGTLFIYAQDVEPLQMQVDEAAKTLAANNIESAEATLQGVLMSDSTFAPAYYVYYELELQRGDLTEAQVKLKKAINNKTDEQSYRDQFEKVRELANKMRDANRDRESGNIENARKLYNEMVESFPKFAEVYYLIGFLALQEDDYKTANLMFGKSKELASSVDKYSKAQDALVGKYFQNGQEAYKIGDYTTAENNYRIVLDIDPTFVYAYLQLGVMKQKQGDLDGAITCLQKGVETAPDNYQARYNLGLFYQKAQKNDDALAQYLEVIKVNPTYSKAYSSAASIYLAKEQLSKAEEYYKKSIELDMSSAAAYEGYGDVLIKLNKYSEAIPALEMAAALAPRNYTTFYRLAQALNHEKRYNEAIDAGKSATKVNPRFAAAFIEMGFAYASLENSQEAINTFNKARTDPRWRKYAEHQIELLREGKPVEP